MIDDRLAALARVLDGPVEPDAVFADRLLESLLVDLGHRSPADQTLGGRLRRALRLDRMSLGLAGAGVAYRVALIGLVVTALIGIAFAAGQLLDRSSPIDDLIRTSQAVYEDPPALVMTIRNGAGLATRLSADGSGTWRIDPIANADVPPGTYYLYGSGRAASYNPQTNAWTSNIGTPPYPFNTPFTWHDPTAPRPTSSISPDLTSAGLFSCTDWSLVGQELVIGLQTVHLVCRDHDLDLWIDRASHLVVRIVVGPAGDWGPGEIDVTSLAVGSPFEADASIDPSAFSWSGPAGAFDATDLPASTRLVVGEPAPNWTGDLVGGGSLSIHGLAGKPVAVWFWATWCSPCVGTLFHDVADTAARYPGVTTITVAVDELPTLQPYAAANGITLPIVVSGSWTVESWGVNAIPTLVFLDASGNVAGAYLSPSASDVRAGFAALAAGQSIPPQMPTPSP